MTENTYIDFKLKDPFNTHKNVTVAGSFNNWDPTVDALTFNDDSRYWTLYMPVDLPVDHKVSYKYVVDENKWICDVSAPLEKDADGNENNVSYVIVKSKSKAQSIAPQQAEIVEDDDKEFDHKSFHENDLFDGVERSDETAPTSGEENNHEISEVPLSIPVKAVPEQVSSQAPTPREVELVQHEAKDNGNSNIPKSEGNFTFSSFWQSLTWFFKYYILSWFYPGTTTAAS